MTGHLAPGLTVVILTYNEARHIARAIASVAGIAAAVVVVDSGSTDDTVAIAQAAGARVLTHPFVNQARQFQWALDHGGIATGWTMRLDADEVVEPDLAAALARELPSLPADVAGIHLDRKHIFMGAWIRHGGRYPVRLLRVWRTGQGRVEDRWMDEHILVHGGRTITLAGGFADANLHDLSFFTDKHNRYATREAIDRLAARHALWPRDEGFSARTVSRQVGIKRRVKERVYNHLPLWAGPLGYFLFRYVVQAGFRDGRAGLIYHLLQGFWYRFLVEAKVVELEAAIANCASNSERIARLAEATGLALDRPR